MRAFFVAIPASNMIILFPCKEGLLWQDRWILQQSSQDCCRIGDILNVEENKLPTSYWYLIEHSFGASANYGLRERLKTRKGKVVRIWSDDRFKYITLKFDEDEPDADE